MSVAEPASSPEAQSQSRPLVLVGNPNVGKSVMFKNLTRRYVTVSNFPGTTVEVARARARFHGAPWEVIDTPGVNDISPRTEDARVTRDVLDGLSARTSPGGEGGVVMQVADAKNLRRALLLTLQLAAFGRPMILVLNMIDELEERGGRIDFAKLSEILGVPVVPAIAIRGQGTEEIVAALARAAVPRMIPVADPALCDEYECNRRLLGQVNEILAQTYQILEPKRASLPVRLGFWAMHPVKGVAFVAVVLFLVFWFVGLFGAGTLVDLLETAVFHQRVNPLAIRVVDAVLPFPHTHAVEEVPFTFSLPITPIHEVTLLDAPRTVIGTAYRTTAPLGGLALLLRFLHDFLVGPYGVVTMALSYALAIVLPIVSCFFLVFSILEDSGYLPRMAIMVNRVFRLMGLNGKAVLPMILGLGCDTMATMSTRILETRKERILTTFLLALAVPCSAQLGVLLAMMASLSFPAAAFWCVLMAVVLLLVGWLTARLFPGGRTEFILEIPPMRRPQLANVGTKTVARLEWYLKEVIPLFVVGTVALFLLDRVGLLAAIARLGEPVVGGWLGLPAQASNAFLIGFLRRDYGAVYLLDAATGPHPLMNQHQVLVAMVTITLFMPCVANFLMIAKEHGMRVAWSMAAFIFPFAFLIGGLVHRLGGLLGL